MKKFIFLSILVLILPNLTFSQTEKEQKTQIRTQSQTNFPSTSQRITTNEMNIKSDIRSQYRETQKSPSYNPRVYGLNRFDNYSRWGRWGAPMYGFEYYHPFIYYDNFGLRQPARVYYYKDGREDTVKGIKTHVRFGVGYSTKQELSGWVTIGNKNYFIAEFSKKIEKNESKFYPNLTMDVVRPWDDERLPDIQEGWSFHVGMGRKLKHFGIQVMIGWNEEEENYQYFDELYILSNNGKYSFRNFVSDYTSIKVGCLKDFGNISTKIDYDPIRNSFNLGLGLLF
jgi:hypothetical protein